MDRGGFTRWQGDSGAQNEYHRRAEHENGGLQVEARRGAAKTSYDPTVTASRPEKRSQAAHLCITNRHLPEVLFVAKDRTA
ncbi:uncharacterized protein RMCN_0540 [Mycolicibacterium novocastrense]|uniref:Uncharacterized protein n=1 Tax=Mycolicibacterium novocastrense TaxID=59813 RepID=A0ABQ0KDG0_MYCNV|nr:uncharacterized protein RMCN_0540 [Mycolicibacterium novocastrense]